MSGAKAAHALEHRFGAIRRAEIDRLEKKLRGLTEQDRQTVEALTEDIIRALARSLASGWAGGPAPHIDAMVRLFALDVNTAPPAS